MAGLLETFKTAVILEGTLKDLKHIAKNYHFEIDHQCAPLAIQAVAKAWLEARKAESKTYIKK